MDFSNNSENSSFGSSNDTKVLNNMLAREILKRQALENKVTTLERQIQALVTDVAATKTTYMTLQHATEGVSLRQNNMAASLQTITQRVDSENDNIKQRLRYLSNITSKLQTSGVPTPQASVAFLARVTTDNPTQHGPTVSFEMTDFNLGNGYFPSWGYSCHL
ncbi:uncharacterized protein LOC125674702 isoform X1 [Ostrea edulis]|nr:uncharacterized protein LOC125674702 isoform X1 [Ostrea edulis]